MKGRKLAAIIAIIYLLILVLCTSTLFWQGAVPELIAKLSKTVIFEEAVLKAGAESVKIVLHEGETALLSQLPKLKSADFCGSDNIDEIRQWAQENPHVAVSYDIMLPDGRMAVSSDAVQDFSAITRATLPAYINCLEYLDGAQQVELGSEQGSEEPLKPGEINELRRAFPHIRFSYGFELLGQSLTLESESLDLTSLKSEDVENTLEYLGMMQNLKSVKLGSQSGCSLSWEEIALLVEACPAAEFDYSFELCGKSFTLAEESMDLSYCSIDDGGEELKAALRCMKKLSYLDMDSCGLTDEEMEEICEEFPAVDVVWRIWFGQLYSVRTDTERILASKPSVGGPLDDAQTAKLKYCTKVKYLDLGHNELISDISFVSHMPELEVFIIAMNPVYDISPLKNCPKIEYLELNTTGVADLSPLSEAKALRHLNISNCYIADISPLYGLTELERLWIGSQTPVPAEQVQQMQSAAPNCKISTVSDDPHGDSWRYTAYDINYHVYTWTPRYELLRQQLGYDYQEYSFYWLDPKCNLPAPPEYADTYYIHEDQLTEE